MTYILICVPRITQYKAERSLKYVFVAYTAEQFQSTEDLRALHHIGDAAARNAGAIAYWVGCSCMPDPAEMIHDVYRICDVIRVRFPFRSAFNDLSLTLSMLGRTFSRYCCEPPTKRCSRHRYYRPHVAAVRSICPTRETYTETIHLCSDGVVAYGLFPRFCSPQLAKTSRSTREGTTSCNLPRLRRTNLLLKSGRMTLMSLVRYVLSLALMVLTDTDSSSITTRATSF